MVTWKEQREFTKVKIDELKPFEFVNPNETYFLIDTIYYRTEEERQTIMKEIQDKFIGEPNTEETHYKIQQWILQKQREMECSW
jgi:hypothetical protein